MRFVGSFLPRMRRALIFRVAIAITIAFPVVRAQSPLFRSASSSTSQIGNDTGGTRRVHWRPEQPFFRYTLNSHLPFSLNDGALWAGFGSSASLTGGIRARWGPLRLVAIPEYVYSDNDSFPRPDIYLNPGPTASRSQFASPWHANGQSIDLPWRFGGQPISQLHPGQSSLMLDVRNATIGLSTENEWWGPGIRNALILSNNGPGFEHAFIRNNRPIDTRIGVFHARWIFGTLRESRYFDFDSTNNLRSISLLGITWTPRWDSGLTLGFARSVFGPSKRPLDAVRDAFQVFADVGHPNARPYLDSTITPGRDQLISFFFRWAFPKDGFEAYAEWARTEIPRSIRDFLIYPNHSQGYTLGLQWLGDTLRWNARLHAEAEFTFLEQSTTYRHREIGSWYTSRAVVQGYTNRGQSLGAAIGPGSSSQWIALDYVLPTWQIGAYVNRIRWMNDAMSQRDYGPSGWCQHDVSLLPGIRGAKQTPFGNVAFDYSSGWRLNIFFENTSGCPTSPGRDARTKSLTLTFAPVRF
jgi:hypothetical protein